MRVAFDTAVRAKCRMVVMAAAKCQRAIVFQAATLAARHHHSDDGLAPCACALGIARERAGRRFIRTLIIL
ncbi:MAG: hypothetical protein FJY56_15230 [Betaproteobacteria bacterium]|nr:hypothetical protein [Betaproteobacteria bacterium]